MGQLPLLNSAVQTNVSHLHFSPNIISYHQFHLKSSIDRKNLDAPYGMYFLEFLGNFAYFLIFTFLIFGLSLDCLFQAKVCHVALVTSGCADITFYDVLRLLSNSHRAYRWLANTRFTVLYVNLQSLFQGFMRSYDYKSLQFKFAFVLHLDEMTLSRWF